MGNTQLVIMAMAMGLMYWIAWGMIGGYFAFFFIASPIVVGVVAGLVYGGLTEGLIIDGGIAAALVGTVAPGESPPTDSILATTTVIPIALATGLTTEQVIAFAAPMGLLGPFVANLCKMISTIFVHRTNESAVKGNLSGVTRCAVVYPPSIGIPLLFLPVFLAVMFGQDAMLTFMSSVPSWVMHGLEIAGGVMPAIGFALTVSMIGKPKMISYMILGFTVVKVVGLNTLTAGLVTGYVAILVILEKREREEEGA